MPEMLIDVTIQPVMFVLLFAFVFGGVDRRPGRRQLPGVAAARDHGPDDRLRLVHRGDRAHQRPRQGHRRPVPVAADPAAAVLVGRSLSSLIHSSIGIVVMSLTGLLIGWRIRNGFVEAVLGYALLLLFGFAMIWVGILVGSSLRSVEAVKGSCSPSIFPITFLANTFAPTENMPTVLRTLAEWNPISSLTQAVRELWGNAGPAPSDAALPLQYPVLCTLLWTVGITAVMAPLALRAFRRRTATDPPDPGPSRVRRGGPAARRSTSGSSLITPVTPRAARRRAWRSR